jgi:hypothetical protein
MVWDYFVARNPRHVVKAKASIILGSVIGWLLFFGISYFAFPRANAQSSALTFRVSAGTGIFGFFLFGAIVSFFWSLKFQSSERRRFVALSLIFLGIFIFILIRGLFA